MGPVKALFDEDFPEAVVQIFLPQRYEGIKNKKFFVSWWLICSSFPIAFRGCVLATDCVFLDKLHFRERLLATKIRRH
jgi:hypothetical protein